jgi:hypothetical protein
MTHSTLKRLSSRLAGVFVSLILAACSGGSGTGANLPGAAATGCEPANAATSGECGSVLVALTDADGDFATYTVDVLSLTLNRASGGSVETLPAATRIDFAELTELAEIVSAATLVPGDVVGGSIRLDYTNAEIFVEAGGELVAADIVDEDGLPLGIVDVEIRLDDREHLVITRGRTALLSVDFDLAVSHQVDTSQSPPLVTAMPYIVAEIEPIDSKEMRLRGALVDVDLNQGSYDITVRPWHHRSGDHGPVTVFTTAATSFEVDDVMYTGQAGLQALNESGAGTMTVAFGTLSRDQHRFTASIVHAGDSLGGERLDAVYGNVVARQGDVLTVKGALTVHRDRPAHFQRTVLVELGPDTTVFKIGDPEQALDKDAISVGQRIVAFGDLAANGTDVGGANAPDIALQLDATQGRVRMLVTHLHGNITSIVAGQINMQLRGIDRLGIDMFDFSGTGVNAAGDADPADYEVGTGTLSLANFAADRWTRVAGFVSPFGAAPPDFTAHTLVDHRDIPATLGIGWGVSGTSAPFTLMGPDSLVPDLSNPDIDVRHHILLGRRLVDLFDLPGSTAILPSDERSVFGIWENGHIELFADFPEFVDELGLRLSNTDTARSIAATGHYDEATNAVTARRIAVHMIAAE